MQWKTKQPKAPKVYEVSTKDMEIYCENISALTQLIAITANNCDLSPVEGLRSQLENSVKFLDDMKFIFNKFIRADAIKIKK